jgi:hypothetical protein
VCRLNRRGKLVPEAKKEKKQVLEYRRPFACAVLPFDEKDLPMNKEMEFTIPLYSTAQENNYATLYDRNTSNLSLSSSS